MAAAAESFLDQLAERKAFFANAREKSEKDYLKEIAVSLSNIDRQDTEDFAKSKTLGELKVGGSNINQGQKLVIVSDPDLLAEAAEQTKLTERMSNNLTTSLRQLGQQLAQSVKDALAQKHAETKYQEASWSDEQKGNTDQTKTVGKKLGQATASETPSVMGQLGDYLNKPTRAGKWWSKTTGKWGLPGKALGAIGTGLADIAAPIAGIDAMTSAYGHGTTLMDDNASSGDKANAVAHLGLQGIGGFIGGRLGGAKGAMIGADAGDYIATGANKIGESLSNTGVGEVLGRGMALAMTPFSAEARDALTKDFASFSGDLATTLKPLSDFGDQIMDYSKSFKEVAGDYVDATKEAASTLLGGISSGLSSLWKGAKGAGSAAVEGYKTGGVTGAITAGAGSLSGGAKTAYGNVSESIRLAGAQLGAVSEKYESGGRGVNTVSTGAGDAGGVSYGAHQLSSKSGTMAAFLASPEGASYAQQFKGLTPGSKEFNDAYKQVAGSDSKGFAAAQQGYITRTHFEPQAQKLKDETGLDVSTRGKGVQEAVYSAGVQYGPKSGVLTKAIQQSGLDVSKASDEELISAIQDYRGATAGQYFKGSSPAVQQSVADRAAREKQTLLAVNEASKKDNATGTMVASQLPSSTTATSSYAPITTQTPVRLAQAEAQPINVQPSAPIESRPVTVDNAEAFQQPQQLAQAPSTAQPSLSTQPNLDDIPVRINELGIIFLNTGIV